MILGKQFVHSKTLLTIDEVTKETKSLAYIERLANINNRIEFDYTCRNITELIASKPKWGVDSSGRVFLLMKKEVFNSKILSIKKKKPGLIWLDKISYPLEIDKTINVDPIDTSTVRAKVIYVDGIWILYEFTYEDCATAKIVI